MNLTFLIDMNLPPAWVDRLAREGWAAVHWSTVGDARATDPTVLVNRPGFIGGLIP
jgi:predicted nuclease of predicted toxin-antitoxin system